MSSAGIHCRAPASAWPVFSRTQARCTVLSPFATRPAQPMYCRFTPPPGITNRVGPLPPDSERCDRVPHGGQLYLYRSDPDSGLDLSNDWA
jgi:hypothetical protein